MYSFRLYRWREVFVSKVLSSWYIVEILNEIVKIFNSLKYDLFIFYNHCVLLLQSWLDLTLHLILCIDVKQTMVPMIGDDLFRFGTFSWFWKSRKRTSVKTVIFYLLLWVMGWCIFIRLSLCIVRIFALSEFPNNNDG